MSLYDRFGFEWTLLRFEGSDVDEDLLRAAATPLRAELKVVTLPRALRDLYEGDLALIRPDQIVAWRGNASQAGRLGGVLAQALGAVLTGSGGNAP